jgi:hypothetical protein
MQKQLIGYLRFDISGNYALFEMIIPKLKQDFSEFILLFLKNAKTNLADISIDFSISLSMRNAVSR